MRVVLYNKNELRRKLAEKLYDEIIRRGAVLASELVERGYSYSTVMTVKRRFRWAKWRGQLIIYSDPRKAALKVLEMGGYSSQKARQVLPYDLLTALKSLKPSPPPTSTRS